MAIPVELLLQLASKLNERWKKRLAPLETGILGSPLELAAAIERLAVFDPKLALTLNALTAIGGPIFDDVEEAVKQFQRKAGDLKVDGILGGVTLSDLATLFGCSGEKPEKKEKDRQSDSTDLQDKLNRDLATSGLWFLYFIESLPDVLGTGAHAIVERAWNSWQRFARVKSQRVLERSQANVIIRERFIDGSGPVLGEAHVGPPFGFVAELEMDSGQKWTPRRFEGAICHEIGHIIGLHHDPVPGRLMHDFLPDLTAPTDADGARARALTHLGPPAGFGQGVTPTPLPANAPSHIANMPNLPG